MQPVLPHGHVRPSLLTTMCPISPAPPRPSQSLPSNTTPPPTPVPQKTPRIELYGRPAPSSNSASVATLTSLESPTGAVSAASSFSASAYAPSQSGRLRALVTVPASSSTTPGDPTPAAVSSPGPTPAWSAASRSAPIIASATSAGPPVVGVGWREEPSTACCSSVTTAWIFVPPRSIPPSRVICLSSVPRSGGCSHTIRYRAASEQRRSIGGQPPVDLNDTPELAGYRTRVRAWLEEHKREAPAARGDDDAAVAARRAWQKRLAEGGLAAVTWPSEYGGGGRRPP